MADPTRDTAAAMLKALRSADLSNQPLAVGLADALDELVDREYDNDCCITQCEQIRAELLAIAAELEW